MCINTTKIRQTFVNIYITADDKILKAKYGRVKMAEIRHQPMWRRITRLPIDLTNANYTAASKTTVVVM